jgi:DNA-binding MarR family transcriptional regulator
MNRLIGAHAPEFTEAGVTMAQAKVLYVVMAAGELRMSELAARLGVSSSSASGLADRLVELGLLRRHDDPDDRRQVMVAAREIVPTVFTACTALAAVLAPVVLTTRAPGELGVPTL